MHRTIAALFALALFAPALASAQVTTTLSGKIVDLATYVTKDHNMDAMHGDAMKGGAMHGDAMKGDAMKGDAMKGDAMKGDATKGDAMKGDAMKGDHDAACPALGLVTAKGSVYLLATQMGTSEAGALCKKLNTTAALTGAIYSKGGVNVFLVGK